MKNSYLLRLHFIVFLWGFTAILGKLISAEANVLVFYRMSLAAVFLYLYLRIFRKQSIKVTRRLLLQLIAIGSVMAFHWLFFFQSIKVSNVSIALSCLSLSTLFAALMEPLIFRRRPDWFEIVIGVIIVICMSLIFNAELKYKEGIFYGILCALFGTIFSVYNGKMFGKTNSGNIIFYEIAGGWLVISLYFLITGQISAVSEISYTDLALITLLASVFTAYPMFESVQLMKFISPFTLILTVNLEPVYGIILAFFIFGASEHMSPVFYGASVVMITAIIVNGIVKSRRRKEVASEETKSL